MNSSAASDSPPIRIRPAERSDIPALCRLLHMLFSIEADFTADHGKQQRGLERLLKREEEASVFVAECAGQVVGMCTVQIVISTAEGGEVGWVEDLVVDEAMRGRGVGALLLHSLGTWAAKRGLTRLQLLADRNNTPALGFYEHQGWQPTQLLALRRYC